MTLAKVKHAQFIFHDEVGVKTNKRTGEEVPRLATRFGHMGQVVDVPIDEEYERGIKSGALEEFTEAPESEVEDEGASEDEELEITTETHDELVEWIRDEKPSAKAVVAAAGSDPEKAKRLMDAENEASGSQPRKSVMDPLRRIAGSRA